MISIRNSYTRAVHLETLRLYCDVVRLRSFSRGATQNFVSQSAASQAMQQLETELGVALLDRTKRPFVVPLRSEPMAFVCHPNHRLARRRIVMPDDLNGETFIAFDAGLTIRKAIDRALRQHNVRVNTVMQFDNIETIKQAIIIAAGVSILPRHTVQNEASIRTLTVVQMGIADLVRPVGLIHRRQKPLTPTVSRFIQLLKDANEEPARVAARS